MKKEGRSPFQFDMKAVQSRKQSLRENSYGAPSQSSKTPEKTSANSQDYRLLFAQIDQATGFLKEKTIKLVCQLRKHSLHQQLELEIESYLTYVLDQMDLIQSRKNTCNGIEFVNREREVLTYFEQLPKPTGDDECFHIQQTYRQTSKRPLDPIEELSKEATQVQLSTKLQSILSQFQNGGNSFTRSSNSQHQKYKISTHSHLDDPIEEHPNENRPKMQQKAHKFSNHYLRDVNRTKKSRIT